MGESKLSPGMAFSVYPGANISSVGILDLPVNHPDLDRQADSSDMLG
jgi:hypothetical protein